MPNFFARLTALYVFSIVRMKTMRSVASCIVSDAMSPMQLRELRFSNTQIHIQLKRRQIGLKLLKKIHSGRAYRVIPEYASATPQV